MSLDPIEVFASRCEARAQLWAAWQISLHDAVDVLQKSAEQTGLIDIVGQDHVQSVMSDAFTKWRVS